MIRRSPQQKGRRSDKEAPLSDRKDAAYIRVGNKPPWDQARED